MTQRTDTQRAVREHLLGLADGTRNPVDRASGVCNELWATHKVKMTHVLSLSSGWGHHSGNWLFPVPGPLGEAPSIAYMNTDDLWDFNTTYGRLRRELCAHMADRVHLLEIWA